MLLSQVAKRTYAVLCALDSYELRNLIVCIFCCFQLEGRKISSSQFLKVLSTLRVWEICAPDINAAIEVIFGLARVTKQRE